jgi:hypothetical protein
MIVKLDMERVFDCTELAPLLKNFSLGFHPK